MKITPEQKPDRFLIVAIIALVVHFFALLGVLGKYTVTDEQLTERIKALEAKVKALEARPVVFLMEDEQ